MIRNFSLLSNSQDGVFVVGPDQRIVMWNKAAEEALGHRASDVIGRPCYEVFSNGGTEGYECARDCSVLAAARQGAVPPSVLKVVRTQSGEWKRLNVTHIGVPVSRARNEMALVHVFRDVTREAEARALVERLGEYVRLTDHQPQSFGRRHGSGQHRLREPSPLSRRETQVLTLLTEGCNSSSIAERLGVSRYTVRNHIQRILEKLKVHDRMGAVMVAIRAGIVAPPGESNTPGRRPH